MRRRGLRITAAATTGPARGPLPASSTPATRNDTLLATHVQVDGNQLPHIDDLRLGCTVEAIIEGDASVAAISAASILAKTFRDAMMRRLDVCYPGFKLAIHKGYGTPAHLEALRLQEPSPLHRRSFIPVQMAMGKTD